MSSKKWAALSAVAFLLVGMTAWSQPPEDGPRGPRGRGPGGPGGPGGQPSRKQAMPQSKFKVGTVIPPHVLEEMELSKEQEEKIKDLEAEVKTKLEKILKKDQLEMFGRPPAFGGMGGPGGPGGPGGRGRGPGGPGGPGGFDGPPPGGPGRGPEGDFPPAAKKKGAGQRKGAQPKRPGPPEE